MQQEIRGILRDAMLAEAHKGAPSANEVSEADVRAFYEKNRATFRDPERRRVVGNRAPRSRHGERGARAAMKAKTAAEWGELVRAKSIDPTAKANVPVDLLGDLGIVSPPDDVMAQPNVKVPLEVRAALFDVAKIGDVHDKVVESAEHKFYVIRLTQKTDAHERTYAEAERSIRVRLVQDKIREKEDALLAQLKAEFPVQIDDAVLATVNVDLAPDGGALAPPADAGLPTRAARSMRRHARARTRSRCDRAAGRSGRRVSRSRRAREPEPAAPRERARPWDWRWQLRHAITTAEALAAALPLTPSASSKERGARPRRACRSRITPYYLSLVDPHDPRCPIRLQCVPDARRGPSRCPATSSTRSARSPTRSPRTSCSATPTAPSSSRPTAAPSTAASAPARAWSATAAALVRSTRSPPRSPTSRRIPRCATSSSAAATRSRCRPTASCALVARLRAIPSVETIRLATRVPVTLPMRITRELVRALRPLHPLWVMTHFNHPKELTPESRGRVPSASPTRASR